MLKVGEGKTNLFALYFPSNSALARAMQCSDPVWLAQAKMWEPRAPGGRAPLHHRFEAREHQRRVKLIKESGLHCRAWAVRRGNHLEIALEPLQGWTHLKKPEHTPTQYHISLTDVSKANWKLWEYTKKRLNGVEITFQVPRTDILGIQVIVSLVLLLCNRLRLRELVDA